MFVGASRWVACRRASQLLIGAFASTFALNIAAARGREAFAIGLLFGLGLLLGLAIAPVMPDYAEADPSALWQSAAATAGPSRVATLYARARAKS